MTPDEARRLVLTARRPEDLFGTDEPRRAYRRLARLTHPDTGGETDAFARLTALWRERASASEPAGSVRS